MKKLNCFFILLFLAIFTFTSYSQCVTFSYVNSNDCVTPTANTDILFYTQNPTLESFTLTTNSTGQIYHCFNYPDSTYFMRFPDLDCITPCDVYFVPNHIPNGRLEIRYGCYPDCYCEGGDTKFNLENNFDNILPSKYELYQNYPNPFNPVTIINFDLPKDSYVNLTVYDLSGTEISILVSSYNNAGNHSIEFDATNLPSGIYVYKFETQDYVMTRKMVLIK